MPLGIDFRAILLDFGSQVGPKLGLKIDKKSIQKGPKAPKRSQQLQKAPRSWKNRFLAGFRGSGWGERMDGDGEGADPGTP